MPPSIATVACGFFILTLFLLERDRKSRVSSALWIPVVWLSLGASRSVSQWLGGVVSVTSADQYVEGSPLDASVFAGLLAAGLDRKSTRLNSSHDQISYAVFCL